LDPQFSNFISSVTRIMIAPMLSVTCLVL
jgi:hypothetical protein